MPAGYSKGSKYSPLQLRGAWRARAMTHFSSIRFSSFRFACWYHMSCLSNRWKTLGFILPLIMSSYRLQAIECFRRIMLTGVVVFIFPGDAAQIAVTIVISFAFLPISEALRPYESVLETWLSRAGHAVLFLSFLLLCSTGLMLRTSARLARRRLVL